MTTPVASDSAAGVQFNKFVPAHVAEIDEMYRFAERIIYPTREDGVVHEKAAE